MSYTDDEELKLGDDMGDEDMDDLDLDKHEPIDDDLVASDDMEDDEEMKGFAGLDGSEY